MESVIQPSDSFAAFQYWVHQVERDVPFEVLIRIISARLSKADDRDHHDLTLMLENLLTRAGRHGEARQLLDDLIARYSDDVRAPIIKSRRLLYSWGDAEGALETIDLGLERANRTGFFRREALGDKARILVKLGHGEELSRVLEEIMSLKLTKGIPDIGRERDFVDRAPRGMIRTDVLARYDEFCPKRPTDPDADEPPEWEHPDDAG